MCKRDIKRKRDAKLRAERERIEKVLAEDTATDTTHLRRFNSAAARFGADYSHSIATARRIIGDFDSIPEAVACIELLHLGTRVIHHQKVGGYVVDFCLPVEKVVVEIDGSLYHSDEAKEEIRDYAIRHMLGEGWTVRHIPADNLSRQHKTFGRAMRKMLNARRKELGEEPLRTA